MRVGKVRLWLIASNSLRIGYTWPASFSGVEPSDPISVDLSSQPINAFNLDQASGFSFDETNFADILNEMEDWEFLQQFGDAPYAYTM